MRNDTEPSTDDEVASSIYQALVAEAASELFCDACGFYPIEPVHGHFVCPACHLPTKCCEGAPQGS